MRTVLCSLLIVLLSTAAMAADPERTVPDVAAVQVAKNTYVIHGPLEQPTPQNRGFMNNPAFILTPEGVVVVDPGSSLYIGEMLLRQLRKHSDLPVIAAFNTHVHGDHWLGNDAIRRAYPEAAIYAHPRMIAAVEQGAGETWIDMMNRLADNAVQGTRVVGPTHALNDGDEIKLGGLSFRIHHNDHAHTLTDIMIEVMEEDLVFTGDNANNLRIVRMDDGSFKGNIDALESALELKRKVYVPGHGQTAGAELVIAYRDYLRTVYENVAELYEEDLAVFEITAKLRPKLTAYREWVGYEQELGKHVSLAYLEAEADAF